MQPKAIGLEQLPEALTKLADRPWLPGGSWTGYAKTSAGELCRRISRTFTEQKYPDGMPLALEERARRRVKCDPDLLEALDVAARLCGAIADPKARKPVSKQELVDIADRLEKFAGPIRGRRKSGARKKETTKEAEALIADGFDANAITRRTGLSADNARQIKHRAKLKS
jgi:hypothetical protein